MAAKINYFSLNGLKIKAKVVKIYDGDTITVIFPFPNLNSKDIQEYSPENNYKWRCRFIKVDASEINGPSKELATKQRDLLRNLIPIGSEVVIHCHEFDKYGRILIELYVHKEKDNEIEIIDIIQKCCLPFFNQAKKN